MPKNLLKPNIEHKKPFSFDVLNGCVDFFGDDISPIVHGAGHVLSVPGVAASHHLVGLEGGVGDFCHGQIFMVGLFCGDDGGVGGKHEVDAGVGNQVGLELVEVDVEGAVEAQRGSQGGNHLADQPVPVGVGGALHVQQPTTNVVGCLVVQYHSHIRVLQKRVGRKDRVVGLNHRGRHLRRWVDGET